ncbi:uncharacterized protein [Acropora muricata]|uniref:uncharacterized protein n=1 Tax=Acropora muricata TaxID=159855 RepID=UPI0034E51C0F
MPAATASWRFEGVSPMATGHPAAFGTLAMELTETTRVKDGYMWRCTNKRCRTWLSIRSGSFFEGSNIMLSCWLHLMFLWAIQISGSRIARLTSLSKPTVVRALGELRTTCSNKVLNAGIKIGGLGKTVEIDESKFGAKRKCKRGRVSEGPWVFGVVERGSQKVLLLRVPDCTRETVHRLITTHIRPGTVIYSDQFTPYIPLNQLGYIHVSVNHSKNFVDPDSGAHTNTIEGVWALVKKKLKWMCGTLYEYIPSYLDEFIWFWNFGKDQAFVQLLKDIAEQFPLQ